MPIKFYNPTSPGRRAGSVLDYRAVITKSKPERSLTEGKRRATGRNHPDHHPKPIDNHKPNNIDSKHPFYVTLFVMS